MPTRVVRPATAADLEAVVALRVEMFRAMGAEADGWQPAARAWFAARLEDEGVRLVVVEVEGAVVATALGAVRDAVPSPTCPVERDVLVSNVCTAPEHRRRGHARAALAAVMDWAATTGAGRAELLATGEGHALYEDAGFTTSRFPTMRAPLQRGGEA